MNKAEAVDSFWNSFGVTAYDENTLPDAKDLPKRYIAYNVATGSLGDTVLLEASIWDKETYSWEWSSQLAEQISDSLIQVKTIPLDIGFLYITRGAPFAQRMSDEDDAIRRIYLNIIAEYLAP